jgi:tRNA(Ile)-lysidine synthase
MARARPLGPACTLIRPLLTSRRGELLKYLDDLGQPYRNDSSNDNVEFTRNRIRHQLLPELAESFNPGVVDAMLRLGILAGEVQSVVDGVVADLAERCAGCDESGAIRIDLAPLAGQPRYVVRELLIAAWRDGGWPLQAMGFAEWDRLAEIAMTRLDHSTSMSQERTFPGNVLADVREGVLWLNRQ